MFSKCSTQKRLRNELSYLDGLLFDGEIFAKCMEMQKISYRGDIK